MMAYPTVTTALEREYERLWFRKHEQLGVRATDAMDHLNQGNFGSTIAMVFGRFVVPSVASSHDAVENTQNGFPR